MQMAPSKDMVGTKTAQKRGIFVPFSTYSGPSLKSTLATLDTCSRPPLWSLLLKLCVIILHTHSRHRL